jgi:small multidrug resistance pump
LRSIPAGVAYAVWPGIGIVLVTLIAWTFPGQKPGTGALAGMVPIIAGAVALNLFSIPLRASATKTHP